MAWPRESFPKFRNEHKTLQDPFLDELQDIYDAEQRIARPLPKMTKAAVLLKRTLDQEKTTDDALTEIARSGNNEEARDGDTDGEPGGNLTNARKRTAVKQ